MQIQIACCPMDVYSLEVKFWAKLLGLMLDGVIYKVEIDLCHKLMVGAWCREFVLVQRCCCK